MNLQRQIVIIRDYFPHLKTELQMHPSHTYKHTPKFLSPPTTRHYCCLSPHHHQKRKKENEKADESHSRKGRPLKERQTLIGDEEKERKSNGSLRKLEKFGKIDQVITVATLTQTHSPRLPPKHPSISEKSIHFGKQKPKTQLPKNVSDFQLWQGVKGGKGSSQYYQSQKKETNHQRFRQGKKMHSKTMGEEVAGLRKIDEVTFSLDSTEPQTDQKQQKNDYQFPQRKPNRPKLDGDTGGQFMTAFRRKIIEKEIVQKEKIYRCYIRSSSRQQNPQQKIRLKSKMKEVLEDLYQLKKIIKN